MDAFAKLGIDFWSILLYLVNFGVLFLVLRHFVYRPLLSFIDKRREVIAENIAEAEAMRKELAEANERHTLESESAMRKLQTQTAEAKNFAKEEAVRLLEEARHERDVLLERTREEVERMKENLIKEVEKEIQERIRKALLVILRDGIPEEVVSDSVETAWKEISAARV